MTPREIPVDTSWTIAPAVLLTVAVYAWVYVRRWRTVRRQQLASAHMVQHLLLADLAPICLILALTKVILRPVTRRVHAIERRAGVLAHPVVGVLAYVGAMWVWHVPAMYDAAL